MVVPVELPHCTMGNPLVRVVALAAALALAILTLVVGCAIEGVRMQ